ncbi:MAG: hypothetical protein GY750_19110 [Lentisphaerae bacterium]|nr:hypothetical protein [Lentisphaerota bacterium]MCP4103508.1 hypothetical protein [Lentisphaerota bacterium]
MPILNFSQHKDVLDIVDDIIDNNDIIMFSEDHFSCVDTGLVFACLMRRVFRGRNTPKDFRIFLEGVHKKNITSPHINYSSTDMMTGFGRYSVNVKQMIEPACKGYSSLLYDTFLFSPNVLGHLGFIFAGTEEKACILTKNYYRTPREYLQAFYNYLRDRGYKKKADKFKYTDRAHKHVFNGTYRKVRERIQKHALDDAKGFPLRQVQGNIDMAENIKKYISRNRLIQRGVKSIVMGLGYAHATDETMRYGSKIKGIKTLLIESGVVRPNRIQAILCYPGKLAHVDQDNNSSETDCIYKNVTLQLPRDKMNKKFAPTSYTMYSLQNFDYIIPFFAYDNELGNTDIITDMLIFWGNHAVPNNTLFPVPDNIERYTVNKQISSARIKPDYSWT